MLSLERVVQKGSRSVASLENGIIRIVKRTGKWEGFESTGTLLEPHEALFLMETVREHWWMKFFIELNWIVNISISESFGSVYGENDCIVGASLSLISGAW